MEKTRMKTVFLELSWVHMQTRPCLDERGKEIQPTQEAERIADPDVQRVMISTELLKMY